MRDVLDASPYDALLLRFPTPAAESLRRDLEASKAAQRKKAP